MTQANELEHQRLDDDARGNVGGEHAQQLFLVLFFLLFIVLVVVVVVRGVGALNVLVVLGLDLNLTRSR